MVEDPLWDVAWHEDWRDYHNLMPEEKKVYEIATSSWQYDFSEVFGWEVPLGFVGTKEKPYLIFPKDAAWNTGIGPPDDLLLDVHGEEFIQKLTQIRVPVIIRHKTLEINVFRDLVAAIIPGPIPPGIGMDFYNAFFGKNLTFILPTPYCGADQASKFLTILRYLEEWKEEIGYEVNWHTSKIVCFKADQAVKEELRREVQALPGVKAKWTEPVVWEFEAPDWWWGASRKERREKLT